MTNPCFNDLYSCSSCCGLHNIGLSESGKLDWLTENTRKFLLLDIENRLEVLNFRQTGEDYLQPTAIRKDVYICPFMGITSREPFKTGCLLHKDGSPHDQIKKSNSPQSFSFYGESICQSYNCHAKQSIPSIFNTVLRGLKSSSPFVYGKITSNHNLLNICSRLTQNDAGLLEKLVSIISDRLAETEIPVTSFEMPLDLTYYTTQDLWNVLGTMFDKTGYVFDAFQVSEEGREHGNRLEKSLH